MNHREMPVLIQTDVFFKLSHEYGNNEIMIIMKRYGQSLKAALDLCQVLMFHAVAITTRTLIILCISMSIINHR